MATVYDKANWEQVSIDKMADVRNLALRGSAEAAAAWSRITERDPYSARVAAMRDDRRQREQQIANAAADLVIKGKKIKIKCKVCGKKHGFASPCKTGAGMGKKNKSRRAVLTKGAQAFIGKRMRVAAVPSLPDRREEWAAESRRWAWFNADPSIREAARAGHVRHG